MICGFTVNCECVAIALRFSLLVSVAEDEEKCKVTMN